jgi:dienelactone hydrolase
MSIVEPFKLDRPGGGVLRGVVDLPEAPGRCPTVVICHGFKGFMEWGFFPAVAELLAQRGFVTVRFNLAGSGMQPGDELVSDPRAFSANTYSAEVADLLRVLEATGNEIADDRVDRGRLGLLGHSRGGGAAILAAASQPWRDRIRALVTWAAISHVDRYTPEEKRIWRATGEMPVVNTRTGQQLALGRGLLEDVERHSAGSLDILAAAGRVAAPWLIVHGGDDESVPASEAAELAARAAGTHELLVIPGAGHTFGAKHPFVGPTPHLIQALNATQTWFRRHL